MPQTVEKPAGFLEFSVRAILCGLVAAAVMGASYPYVVLKLGSRKTAALVGAVADRRRHRHAVPASVIIVMFLGGAIERIWRRVDRGSNELYMTPLASGLIAGEAIIAVIIPLLVVLGLVTP